MSENDNARAPFRVLALDGGGIKGTFTAAVIAELEQMTGKRVVEHFDLVTGTSTGGIIAVALGLGLSGKEVLEFYLEKGPLLFPAQGRLRGLLNWLCGPKLCDKTLRQAITAVTGERRFGESACRLVIPAYDAVRGSIQLFKTAHAPQYKQDYLLPAATVAMGTSAAPSYYPAHLADTGGAYLDGGVWANCPAMVGLLEATCVIGRNIDDIELLSIGTTTTPYSVTHRKRRGGLVSWNKGLIDIFAQAQVEAALGQARLMTKGRMLRVDQVTEPGRFCLDGASETPDLMALGQQAARQHEPAVSARFFFAKAAPFVPYYPIENASERRAC